MTTQVAPWQEAFNVVTRLSIAEQLQVLVALMQKLRKWLPDSLRESDVEINFDEGISANVSSSFVVWNSVESLEPLIGIADAGGDALEDSQALYDYAN
ncbi:MAG: hypothetical protein AAF639_11565 [Chloroflexota bacterium]